MSFEYLGVEAAKKRDGLRMVVISNIPSPWAEAAKGIFHLKGLNWVAVRLDYNSESLFKWTGERSAPVLFYNDEPPRSGWKEILTLAETLTSTPQLVPNDDSSRELVMQMGHEICGKDGLGWTRRLQLIHTGLQNAGGFPLPIAKYLSKKYGYSPDLGSAAAARNASQLQKLTARLKSQRKAGSSYYVGGSLTAVDIYSAAFLTMFKPLTRDECKMDEVTRAVFESRDLKMDLALDPVLFEHRDMMYANHLELPLSL